MNFKETNNVSKNSLLYVGIKLIVPAAFIGLLFTVFTNYHREYSAGNNFSKEDEKNDRDAIGMEKYFFNARKNIHTNSMDYNSMLAADMADRAMSMPSRSHSAVTVPTFNWISMGPTNIGGRTRAILIDKNDPTHQTLFAGGVSGGIWKSTNAGGTWGSSNTTLAFSQNDTLQNMNICSIAQDANGAIYIGTGEGVDENTDYWDPGQGFSSGELGAGMFKSTDDGVTWRLLPSTKPTVTNSSSVAWGYINRIAIRPDNIQVIYAATNSGLYVSHDSGTTWVNAINSANSRSLTGVSPDVKISNDGSVVVACIGGAGYYCYPQINPDNSFTQIPSSGLGHLPAGASRIEFAIAPSDPNRIYCSLINSSGAFGSGGAGSGIYMTKTATINGGYWYLIGPGGSESFNPYAAQADYDNTIAVAPSNEGMILVGGATMWEWNQFSPNDSTGTWQAVSHYNQYFLGDPLYVHPDEHAIVFDLNNPSTAYFGCDGGVFVSNNILDSIDHLVFSAINRNYNVTQYYTVCYSPYVNYDNVNYGNSTMEEGLGLGGGTQDNGSPYVSGNGGVYLNDAVDMSGGDGAGAVVSSLNPNIAYFTSDNGAFLRTSDLGQLTFPTFAYTQTYGQGLGADIDSTWQVASGSENVCFVMPCALYENGYDTYNHDSMKFVGNSIYDTAGATIWLTDQNGPTTYPYVLPALVPVGDTIMVPDRVVSRIAVGFSPTYGIWMSGQGASNNTVIWMPIAGPNSQPTAFSGTLNPVRCLAWTPDGDALFAGTEGGTFFRFSNINSIIADDYNSGALWYKEAGQHNLTNQVVSTNLSFTGLNGRDIMSIAVDPQNGNNVIVTLGNYGESAYVYYSNNALAATPSFVSVQGNLPDMPVYSSILDIDSAGTWITKSAMVATEHGIYTTTDITLGSSTKWIKNSNGLPNVLTQAIKQQTLPPWNCNNSGDIYAGTHGRGIWASTTNYIPTSVPTVSSPAISLNNLQVYPNPMTTEGTIEFNLASSDNVTIIIYDMQGKVVKTLRMGITSKGIHKVQFNPAGFPGGEYFATLTGTDFRKVAKFMVVK